MSRYLTRGLQAVVDLTVLSIAYWFAFLLRFEFAIPKVWLHTALLNWGYVVVIQYVMCAAFGVVRMSWRYVSLREVLRIGVATGSAALALVGLRFAFDAGNFEVNLFIVPISVVAITTILAFVALIGVRATRRLQGEATERRRRGPSGG
ncbi:MAG: hypothetical protein H0V17_07330, partial [Deltaproteobacteria bacterium]|nr:hypothetical protein [Deltaproteobacteria bacterium]